MQGWLVSRTNPTKNLLEPILDGRQGPFTPRRLHESDRFHRRSRTGRLRPPAMSAMAHSFRTRTDQERPHRVCAVKGGAFQWVQIPPGETLQPEATGAVMEVTKWLKPSV